MDSPKVKLQFWMADRLGWTQMGPMIMEEPLEEGDSLRSLLNRLAGQFSHFAEAVFDPQTQSLSSEVSILINDHVILSQGMDTKLKNGDQILFLPILAGG
jgi:molybdopterin converting factor small subunit